METDILSYDFDGIEERLHSAQEKINYNILKTYISHLESNYFGIKRENLERIIEYLKKDTRKNVQQLATRLERFIVKTECEISRVRSMYDFDKKFGNYIYVAGVDEVGRGPLAGPIAAAAVVLKLRYKDEKDLILGVKDSKRLSAKNREYLAKIIKEKAIDYSISVLNSSEIDDKGIAWCNNEVLRRAVLGLKVSPDIVLSDGYAVKNLNIDNEFIIKGDAKSASIACASIVAKVYRDNLMNEYDRIYPGYAFDSNAGYGTEEHIRAIKEHGVCKIHRMSFLKNII